MKLQLPQRTPVPRWAVVSFIAGLYFVTGLGGVAGIHVNELLGVLVDANHSQRAGCLPGNT